VGQFMAWWRLRRGQPAQVPVPPAAAERPAGPPRAAPPAAGTVLLRARGVRKHFRGVQALRGVDVEVRAGEILRLRGPNGSGKATFINVGSGHCAGTQGETEFEGRCTSRLPARQVARSGIARTYQIPRPFAHLSVLENVALPAMFGAAALGRAEAERAA